MNAIFSISLSIFLSLSLLSVEYIQCYHCDKGIDIELLDTSEESPTEDNKDSELDIEINVWESNYILNAYLENNLVPPFDMCSLLSLYYTDIPLPPPDFS